MTGKSFLSATDEQQALTLIDENEELFAEVIAHAITKRDVVLLGYRKKQIEVFRRLLEDVDYFAKIKAAKRCKSEDVWQKFFEKNPWIFGYGLNYIFLETLDHKKLEQYVQGFHVGGHAGLFNALN